MTAPDSALSFLIDENLSPHLKYALAPHAAIHTRDLGQSLTDSALWHYATEHQLVILTKDADFVDRMILADPTASPRAVIQLHCGNLRAGPMRLFLERHLAEMLGLCGQYRLIHLYPEHLEAF
ncbi:DUF5615 family PIN-like protein [Deinococcus sp.]|uniref:DUF5615 family PIN-like protein n=1 Tax=Deinococcus sp. TaxID=47478 RepID=UPI003B5AD043